MKKLLMRTILGFSSLLLMVSNSNAGPLENISGFSVGVSGSHAVYAATGVEKEDGEQIKEYGAFTHSHGSVFVELNINDAVSVGLDWTPSEITTPQALNAQHDDLTSPADPGDESMKENKAQVSFENHTLLYLKADTPVELKGGNFYFLLGVSTVDILTEETLGTGGRYPNSDTTGVHFGLGFEKDMDNGMFIRAQVVGADYDDVEVTNANNTSVSVKAEDMIGAQASISVGKSF